MRKSVAGYQGTVSVRGRTITNLHHSDDTSGLAASEDKLADLINCIESVARKFGMQVNTGKMKLMINGVNYLAVIITISGKKLEIVQQFKYLVAIMNE